MSGPLSAKQHREYLAHDAKQKREDEKLRLEEQRKNDLHNIKLNEAKAKANQGLIHKEQNQVMKLSEGSAKVPPMPRVPSPDFPEAKGTDTVPAMLTPGEAVIPRSAAQDPSNKPIIEAMVQEGRDGNRYAEGTTDVKQPPKLGSGLLETARRLLGGRKKQIDEQIEQAEGVKHYRDGVTDVPGVETHPVDQERFQRVPAIEQAQPVMPTIVPAPGYGTEKAAIRSAQWTPADEAAAGRGALSPARDVITAVGGGVPALPSERVGQRQQEDIAAIKAELARPNLTAEQKQILNLALSDATGSAGAPIVASEKPFIGFPSMGVRRAGTPNPPIGGVRDTGQANTSMPPPLTPQEQKQKNVNETPLKTLEAFVSSTPPAAQVDTQAFQAEAQPDSIREALAGRGIKFKPDGTPKSDINELTLAGTLKDIFKGFKSLTGLEDKDLARFAMVYAGGLLSGGSSGGSLRYAGKDTLASMDKRETAEALANSKMAEKVEAAKGQSQNKRESSFKDLVNSAKDSRKFSQESWERARRLIDAGDFESVSSMLNNPAYGTPEYQMGLDKDTKKVHIAREGFVGTVPAYEDPKAPGQYMIPRQNKDGSTSITYTSKEPSNKYFQKSPSEDPNKEVAAVVDKAMPDQYFVKDKNGQRVFDMGKEEATTQVMDWVRQRRKLGQPDDPNQYMSMIHQSLAASARSGEKRPNITKLLDMAALSDVNLADETKLATPEGKRIPSSVIGDITNDVTKAFEQKSAVFLKHGTPNKLLTESAKAFEVQKDKISKDSLLKLVKPSDPYYNQIKSAPNDWWAYVYFNMSKS